MFSVTMNRYKTFCLCFRTNDEDHPGPYRLEPICLARGLSEDECWNHHPLKIALQIFLCCLFIRELLECFTRGPNQYFKSKENYLQLVIYLLTTLFLITVTCHMVMANHFAAWAVFFACLNVTQLFGRIDFFGKVIFMAFNVSKEIAKTLFVFLPSMAAFVFAFNMLYQADPVFHGIFSTLVKVLVMMQGEFDFDDNLSYQNVKNFGGRNVSIQVILHIFQLVWKIETI